MSKSSVTIFGIDTVKICDLIAEQANNQTGFKLQNGFNGRATGSKQKKIRTVNKMLWR